MNAGKIRVVTGLWGRNFQRQMLYNLVREHLADCKTLAGPFEGGEERGELSKGLLDYSVKHLVQSHLKYFSSSMIVLEKSLNLFPVNALNISGLC